MIAMAAEIPTRGGEKERDCQAVEYIIGDAVVWWWCGAWRVWCVGDLSKTFCPCRERAVGTSKQANEHGGLAIHSAGEGGFFQQ
jgi:hypothetical protein